MVIFSSGHLYHHPTTLTATRYQQKAHVPLSNILRTDRGDDEGGEEWSYGRVAGTTDKYNDDNIQIQLKSDGTYKVYYLNP